MKPAQTSVRENLDWLIKASGTNAYELQRATGVPQPTIHRILTGESADPRTATLDPIARYFGITVAELRTENLKEIGSFRPGSSLLRRKFKESNDLKAQLQFDENVKPAQVGSRPIPVISSVQAGALRDMDCPYEPGDGYAVEYTDDVKLSRWTFGLDVEGDSMLPRFQPGDRLIVDPEREPKPGNFVIARNGSDQATFKKYRPRGINAKGDMIFELVPMNDDYPTLRSDMEPLTIIGVVTEVKQKLI